MKSCWEDDLLAPTKLASASLTASPAPESPVEKNSAWLRLDGGVGFGFGLGFRFGLGLGFGFGLGFGLGLGLELGLGFGFGFGLGFE